MKSFVSWFGWAVVAMGLGALVLPFLPRNDGTASGTSPGLVITAIVLLVVGAAIVLASRSATKAGHE